MNSENIFLVKSKNTGEMFIGQYDSEKMILKESYMVQIIPTNQNSFNIMLLPVFMPLSKNSVDLNIADIILAMDIPTEDLKTQYIAAVTNIVISSNASQLIKG